MIIKNVKKCKMYGFDFVFLIFFFSLIYLTIVPHFCIAAIQLNIAEPIGIDRQNEMVHNGIPIAKSENLTTASNLIIEDKNGSQVPASFEVLSRWGGSHTDVTKPIQWMLVSFPASIAANEESTFFLKTGIPIEKTNIILINQDDQKIIVNTGPAKFVISKTNMSLFDSISIIDGVETKILENNGGSYSTIDGQTEAIANPPAITFERNNDQYLCIKLEGNYANTPLGAGSSQPLSYKIRYEFFAGEPSVVINHKFLWTGYEDTRPNDNGRITVNNVSLKLPDMINYLSTDVYADETNFFTGSLNALEMATIKQSQRSLFTDPHLAQLSHGANSTSITFTEKPMLINRSNNGVIAVTIDHMKFFEPQSITSDSKGKITVNVLDGNQAFAACQGTWARVGISVLPTNATYTDTLKRNFAPLTSRIFAFPASNYVKGSKVFYEILSSVPSVDSSTELKQYYDKLCLVTFKTKTWLDEQKFRGIMTWGGLVRYPTETGTGTGADKIYEDGKLTDYHNAWHNIIFQFLMEGDSSVLYDYAFMGARRMLNTQIIQPNDTNSDSRMGWGYSGYAHFRSDGNSSHSYFENLYSYYYLTGDMEVIDILKIGAMRQREYYTRNTSGDLFDMNTPGADWVDYTGRPAYQFASMFNFIGHTYDATYLDDFIFMYHHAFSTSVALLLNGDGKEYGFISTSNDVNSGFLSEQYWMLPLYFMHGLYIIYNEFGDITLGSSSLDIKRAFAACAQSYIKYVSRIHVSGQGDGSWNGAWVNAAYINYTGNKIGGTIISVVDEAGSNLQLYVPGKSLVTSLIFRAAAMNKDTDLLNFARQGVSWLLTRNDFINAGNEPWGKENAERFIRLHHSMSYYDNDIKGDLNSDGKVDSTDVQACVNHFLGVQDWGTKADVNSDGAVNVLDVQAIVNIILFE